jgi:hypothetical protein
MPNIRAARSVLPQFKPHTERSVLGGAKVVRCGAVCSGRARQMSLGPAPSLLVSSLGGCSHPPTSVQRIKSNPLTLAPGRSGSAALPSSAPFQSSDPHSSLRARLPYRSATRPLHFQVTHPSSPPHFLPPATTPAAPRFFNDCTPASLRRPLPSERGMALRTKLPESLFR